VTATKGDLFYFLVGSTRTFTTEDFGLTYFVGQRGEAETWSAAAAIIPPGAERRVGIRLS
jgi:hypothetical protein